jgi:hypothetical protein
MTVSISSTLSNGGLGQDVTVLMTTPKVMTTGDIIFTTSGDILMFALLSECYTVNSAAAATVQYSVTNNNTATTTAISGVSASLASAAVGVSIITQLGALANVPVVTTASGVGVFPWGAVRIPGNSQIKLVVATGPTTGTWKHYIKYQQLEAGATVS